MTAGDPPVTAGAPVQYLVKPEATVEILPSSFKSGLIIESFFRLAMKDRNFSLTNRLSVELCSGLYETTEST